MFVKLNRNLLERGKGEEYLSRLGTLWCADTSPRTHVDVELRFRDKRGEEEYNIVLVCFFAQRDHVIAVSFLKKVRDGENQVIIRFATKCLFNETPKDP